MNGSVRAARIVNFVWLVSVAIATVLGTSACSNKLDPKECAKLREAAFDEINSPHMCSKDSDCQPSSWPGCAKPLNASGVAKLTQVKADFDKGKCEEKAMKCDPPPTTYCQEGLCAFKYAEAPRPSGGEMPADKIQINP
jgi:hypothetical protein